MFKDKTILDARFANAAQDTIAVLYEEGDEAIEVYVEVNESDPAYQSLVEAGLSQEKIIDNTAEAKRKYMAGVYERLREEHKETHDVVIAQLETELEAKKAELASVAEQVEFKREEFLTAIAAIKALNDKNNITSEQ